jgi:FkbM family methyltransferase
VISPAVPDPPEIEARLWTGFKKTRLAFDIGANCGQSLPHIHEFAEKIVAFEPSFEAVDWVRDNLPIVNDFTIMNSDAVSSHTGTIDLYAIPEKIDTGQLVSNVKGMEWHVPGLSFARPVTSITLDDAVQKYRYLGFPGFIKIDVEGHEWEILRVANTTLDIIRPEFLIEIHDRDLGSFIMGRLLDSEYNMEVVRHPHYEVGSDLYWTHFWVKAIPDGV